MRNHEKANQHTYSTDGTRIAFSQIGSGPALLLIHGSGSDQTRWSGLLPYLTPYFTLYCMDRRGRGESGDRDPYSIQREYEDVCAVAKAIGSPLNILAHSFGAACALGAATSIPTLERLVLYEPPLLAAQQSSSRLHLIEQMESALDRGDREFVVFLLLNGMLQISEATIKNLNGTPIWSRQVAVAHTIPRELRCSADYERQVIQMKTNNFETLFLLGSESHPSFERSAQTLIELVPDSKLALLPQQHHSAMVTAPDVLAEAVLDFFLCYELGC